MSPFELVEDEPKREISMRCKEIKEIEIDFDRGVSLSKEEIRKYIRSLESHLLTLPQVEIEPKHYFSKGVYGREITIDAKTLIVGKTHKYQVMNVLSKGEVSVLSIDGVMRIKAPYTFVSSPGAKRVIYAHEDSVWLNFHGTDETDVSKIEDEFIIKNDSEIESVIKKEIEGK